MMMYAHVRQKLSSSKGHKVRLLQHGAFPLLMTHWSNQTFDEV